MTNLKIRNSQSAKNELLKLSDILSLVVASVEISSVTPLTSAISIFYSLLIF